MALLSRNSYAFSAPTAKGGLIHVTSQGTNQTHTAFQTSLRRTHAPGTYFIWVAQDGVLYAESLQQQTTLPVERLLIVKARDAPEVWRIGLEAVQTGLFSSVFLRADSPCQTAHLRKLQLVAEKNRSEVFLLTAAQLPHWTLKETIHANPHAHPVLHQPPAPRTFGREQLSAHPQGLPARKAPVLRDR